MTPGIPWSVLGIQPDARATAEAEARRAGVPVGEWLNEMIRRTGNAAPEPPVLAHGGTAQGSTLRSDYERLTAELAALNLRDAETGIARASAATGGGRAARHDELERGGPRDGEPIEVIERTIHAIIQHLETSDQRNANALRALQAEMHRIAARADAGPAGENGEDPRRAIASIEERLEALAGKIEAGHSTEPHPDAEGMEDRLAELAARIERLTGREVQTAPTQPARAAKPDDKAGEPMTASAPGAEETNDYETAFMRRRARRRDARHGTQPASGGDGPRHSEAPAEHVSERFTELAGDLQSSLTNPSPPQEVAELHRLVHELSAKVDALAAREPAPAPVDPELPRHVAELSRRLDAAEARFGGLESIEPTLAEIAARIDAAEARFGGVKSIEPTLVELTARIDAAEQSLNHLASAREDTANGFERQFASLFDQLEQSRQAMIDSARMAAAETAGEAVGDAAQQAAQEAVRQAQDAAVTAAQEAARSYMETATAAGSGPRSDEDARVVEMLQHNLQQLRNDLDSADRKSDSAFEAVQATLQGIAERLMSVEEKQRHETLPRGPAPSTDHAEAGTAPRSEPTETVTAAAGDDAPAAARPPLPEALAGLRLPPLGKPAFEGAEARPAESAQDEVEGAAEQVSEAEEAKEMPEELNRPREPGSGPPPSMMPDLGMQLRPADERKAAPSDDGQSTAKPEHEPVAADVAPDSAPTLSGARTTNELLAAARRAAEAAAHGGKGGRGGRPSLKDRLRIPLSRRSRGGAEAGKEAKSDRSAAAKPSKTPNKAAGRPAARKPIVLAVAAVILFAGSIEIYNMLKKRSAEMLQPPETSQEESMGAAEPSGIVSETALPDAASSDEAQSMPADVTDGALQQFEAPQQANSSEPPTGALSLSGETAMAKTVEMASVRTETPAAEALSAALMEPVGGDPLPTAVAAQGGEMPELPETLGTPALRQAAVAGDAIAQFEVASRLAEGRGVKADAEAAAAWYRAAAASGLAPAQYRLGSLYEKGVGVPQDRDAARVWYERAAAQGNRKAMHNLAVLHADGVNGQPNFEAAARWFRAAADLGLADSQYNLGILYARGLGVPQNFSESYKWFSILANRGDKDAAVRREAVAEKLDQQTLAATKLAAKTWKAKRLDPEANAVRLPNEGWAMQLDQAPSAQPGAEIIRNAQKLLVRLGYEPGPVDGQWGPMTRGAIESFQRDAGLQPTGTLTPDLIRKLQQQTSS